jgi:antirestriction protein ArdC
MSDAIHQIITERMIAALQRGTVPWHKPWQAAGRPRSMSTGQPYRGVNVFLLALTAAEERYGSPFWGTYRQIGDLGGQVRKGERSTFVVFYKQVDVADRDQQTGEITARRVPLLRYYRVFNAAQASNLPERFYPAPGEHREISQPQALLDGYLARGPELRHVAGDRADYHPATDTIRLPLRAQFRSAEGYYATAFHEAGHSTGHPSRLNRPGIAAFDHFGSGAYAREELIAQMTSSILCAQAGIDNPELFENSASYIAGWLSALNDDKKLVVAAAAQAQRACDLITQAEREATSHATSATQPAPAGSETVPATASTSPPPCPRNASHGRAADPASDRPSRTAGPPHRKPTLGSGRGDMLTRPAAVPAGDIARGREHHAQGRGGPQPARDWQAEAG